jgi:hypothetical protein
VQQILDQIDALCRQGATIKSALAQVGVSYSNYNYWTKKRAGVARLGGRGKRGGRATSVVAVLNRMASNRREREQLERRIASLDALYAGMKRSLGS